MALLLNNDPCDNFTAWTTGGSPSISASGHTGNAFSFPSGSSNFASYNLASGDQTDTLTVGCWLKLGTLNSTQDILTFRSDAGATGHVAVRVDTAGSVSVRRLASTILGTISAAGTIVVGTWYYIEASVKLADSGGFAFARVNGVEVTGASGVDTKNAGTKTVFDQVRFTSAGTISNWFVDDVYIRNDDIYGTTSIFTGIGTGAIAFGGSGTATTVYSGTGTGAISFGGAGAATVTSTATGTGAITFDGSGSAAVTGVIYGSVGDIYGAVGGTYGSLGAEIVVPVGGVHGRITTLVGESGITTIPADLDYITSTVTRPASVGSIVTTVED